MITVTTASITVTVKRHRELNHRQEYEFLHYFEWNRRRHKVEITYKVDGIFDATLLEDEGFPANWQVKESTWNDYHRSPRVEEIVNLLRPVDCSAIQSVREQGGNVSDEITIKLLQIGEYMLRKAWWWNGYSSQHDEVKVNYGGPVVREVIPEPQILIAAPAPLSTPRESDLQPSYSSTRSTRTRSTWGSGPWGSSSTSEEIDLRREWEESVTRGEAKCGCGQCSFC